MSARLDRVLAEGVRESIHATTPHNRNRHAGPRFSLGAALAWTLVAFVVLFTLAAASVPGA